MNVKGGGESDLNDLARALGHDFSDPADLQRALIHRSYATEHVEVEDNERLEFFGDAVLQLVVTHHLYEHYPHLSEGQMAKVRAACVNRDELGAIARDLDLGDYLLIGVGEEASGGREKTSILADAMEAVLAAVYLDGGLEAARKVVLTHWGDAIESRAAAPGRKDYKTRLQEKLAADGKRPVYQVVAEGPDHERRFTATVLIDGEVRGVGRGRSKKEAEQAAARAVLG